MLETLFIHPEKGFLHGEFFWNMNGPVTIQYWKTFEDLERFSREPSEPHLAAWQNFNKAVASNGIVGIWHETYLVQPDQFECIYGNMPEFGLGKAIQHVQVSGARKTARLRLNANQP
jgi:hypothetical protein